MPGIAGIIGGKVAQEGVRDLASMTGAMRHEAFYSSGTYINESLGLALGWVAHPGSFGDAMPIWNASNDVCMVFAGEGLVDEGELQSLKARGHRWNPRQDAGYLLPLYEEFGLGFVEHLEGWFSGMVIDLRRRTAALFNDRYGLHRIYCSQTATGLYFASEAKALLAALPELRRVDPVGLAETFALGCVLENRSLFEGIALMPGGSMWTVSGTGVVKRDVYFRPEQWESMPRLNEAEYYSRLREVFPRILPKYFRGSQQVGMSLTGGLDGRMMMAWANLAADSVPCYTFAGTYRDCYDVKIARQVARLCGQHHATIEVGREFLAQFPALAEKTVHVSDGCMDVGGAVELYVNRIARDFAPIRLTGNYGSEIVRGNVAFRPGAFREELLAPGFAEHVRNGAATYENAREGSQVSFVAFKQVPWHHYSRLSVEQSQLTLRSPYLDTELVALMHQAPHASVVDREPSLRLISEGSQQLARMPTDRGLSYRPIPGLTRPLRFYREFTAKAEYAYDYGMPQWLARIDGALMPLHLERLFLGRHKFYHFRVWYRDRLGEYLKEILLDNRARTRSYVDGRAVERMLKHHLRGTGNYTSEIHRLLTAELFHRTLIDQPPASERA